MSNTAQMKINSSFDPYSIKRDFPVLDQNVNEKPLVYLDNAATTQKPETVIKSIEKYYQSDNSNVHRGVHTLSQRASDYFDISREYVKSFINAASTSEIIFTRGATEAINLVAQSYGRSNLNSKDEILITAMEHHANIVPWQILCEQTGASLKVVPMMDNGELSMDDFEKLISKNTKIVALTHISNVLGTVNPVRDIVKMSHAFGAVVLVDGAQSVAHCEVDMQVIDCDFFVFSGHKLYGPTGIGVLYGRESLLEIMPPWQGGGDMIRTVSFEKSTWNDLPYKFEAGTPDIAGVIGLGAAIKYIESIGINDINLHEQNLLKIAEDKALNNPAMRVFGSAKDKAGIISFNLEGIHAHDVGTLLDSNGVAIRTGHHCAMPIMNFYDVPATARASFSLYNTPEDIDALFEAIDFAQAVFSS